MTQTGQRMKAGERREAVLAAAVTEFAARGLAGTSTEDVARRAGISQPYLFRLFPTKKALFLALVDRCFRQVAAAFEAAAADRVGEDALDAMADAYHQLLQDRTLLLLQLQAYAACDDPEIRDATRTGFKQLWALVGAAERAALRAGRDVLRHGHADERGGGDGPAGRQRAMDPVVFAMSSPAAASSAAAPARTNFFSAHKLVTTHFLERHDDRQTTHPVDLRGHLGGPVHGVTRQPRGDHRAAVDP